MMKKALYVLLVLVVLLGMLPSAAEAKKPAGMYITDVSGYAYRDPFGRPHITVWVTIKDVNGNPVEGADVVSKVLFSIEDSKPTMVTAITDANGVATYYFGVEWLTLTVGNVQKKGYVYLDELNLDIGITLRVL
jgi:hypothetical protein